MLYTKIADATDLIKVILPTRERSDACPLLILALTLLISKLNTSALFLPNLEGLPRYFSLLDMNLTPKIVAMVLHFFLLHKLLIKEMIVLSKLTNCTERTR